MIRTFRIYFTANGVMLLDTLARESYLLNISNVDPLKHDLIFERFLNPKRISMPDIDIDFPDIRRQEVIADLSKKYGADKVAHIGTISRYKPKSAIAETAKELGVDYFETEQVKNSIIDRSLADARASMCIQDTLESTDVGKQYMYKNHRHVIRWGGGGTHVIPLCDWVNS